TTRVLNLLPNQARLPEPARLLKRGYAQIRLIRSLGGAWASFLLCVVLPTFVILIYLGCVASREYVAEARFVVRSAADPRAKQDLGNALSMVQVLGIGPSGSQDAFIVTNYIKGRTIVSDIGGKAEMVALYSRPDIDGLSRLSSEAPLESVWK